LVLGLYDTCKAKENVRNAALSVRLSLSLSFFLFSFLLCLELDLFLKIPHDLGPFFLFFLALYCISFYHFMLFFLLARIPVRHFC